MSTNKRGIMIHIGLSDTSTLEQSTLIIIIIIIIWLKSGDIKEETESTLVAAQDQAINTNYILTYSMKQSPS
jgi:hypothetical protein